MRVGGEAGRPGGRSSDQSRWVIGLEEEMERTGVYFRDRSRDRTRNMEVDERGKSKESP